MYKDYVIKDLPVGAWIIDENGFLQDYSGYGRHGDTRRANSGSFLDSDTGLTVNYSNPIPPVQTTPIIANSMPSIIVSNAETMYLPLPPLFMSAQRTGDFTIEAWFKPATITSITTVVGHGGTTDGITYDGESIRFRTIYLNTGTAECQFFPAVEDKVFHVVGVHAQNRNRLFVDGILVAETILTADQEKDSYATFSEPGAFRLGYAALAGNSLFVEGVAIYNRALSSASIAKHYEVGRSLPNHQSVIEYYGGAYWDMTDRQAEIASILEFGPWDQGLFDKVYKAKEVIYPEIDPNGLTYAGVWKYGTSLLVAGEFLSGSKIEWDGDGAFVVESSLDAEQTWTVCENGREVPGISENFLVGTKSLSIRIRFTAGEAEATTIAKVRSLKVKLYSERAIVNSRGNQFIESTGNMTLASDVLPIIDQNKYMGADLYNASLLITPVNLDQDVNTAHAVSFWVRPQVLDVDNFLIDLRTVANPDAPRLWWNGTSWQATSLIFSVNGTVQTPSANSIPLNNWSFVAVSFQEPTVDAFTVASRHDRLNRSNVRIASLSIYHDPLDSTEISQIYRSYLGVDRASAGDGTIITLTDTRVAPSVYSFNWSYFGV